MIIENRRLEELHEYENNPRLNDGAVEYVKNSIEEFGFRVPVVVDKDGVIVCGHTRYKAAKKLKLAEVPCIVADDLTPEQVKAFRLADNKTGELALWDEDLLKIELDGLVDDFNMDDFGFDLDLDGILEDEKEIKEDEIPLKAETRCKLGDLWQLGEHRLICGDSTDVAVIDRLMDGVKADMVMTDPPYGINAEKMTMGTGAKEFYRGEDWDSERPDISIAFTLADNICKWWKPATYPVCSDFETMRVFWQFKKAVNERNHEEAERLLKVFEIIREE